jgi:3-oxoacyl-[acyl-carrier-protein] synthase-3
MTGSNAYITDISAFMPNDPVSNDEMEGILGQVGNRPSRARRTVLRSNGITSRHYAIDPETLKPNYSNASMTAEAVRTLAERHISLADIDCLSCGTSIPDQLMPNHAAMTQGELKLPQCEAVATSGVCVSGMAALKYAYMAVLSGQHKNAVATGSDLSSASMTAKNFSDEVEIQLEELEKQPELAFEKDFLRWMLSDGAGAMLVQPQPNPDRLSLRIDWMDIFSYAGEMEACMYAGAAKGDNGELSGWQTFSSEKRANQSIMAVKQDVKLLNDNIIHYTVEKPLQALQKKHQLDATKIDWFVPHYSSKFFRDKVHQGMCKVDFDIPQQRWFTNLSEKGNTGAASMYIMLEELFHSKALIKDQTVLCYIPESGRFSSAFLHLTVV